MARFYWVIAPKHRGRDDFHVCKTIIMNVRRNRRLIHLLGLALGVWTLKADYMLMGRTAKNALSDMDRHNNKAQGLTTHNSVPGFNRIHCPDASEQQTSSIRLPYSVKTTFFIISMSCHVKNDCLFYSQQGELAFSGEGQNKGPSFKEA